MVSVTRAFIIGQIAEPNAYILNSQKKKKNNK